MTEQTVHTFCRVCEPCCGLVGTVRDGELVKLAPDKEHPISKGFCCHKGLAALDVHRDPDRLDVPLRRTASGRFEEVSWDEAFQEIGARLQQILEESGGDAVSSYIGNPSAFNALARPSALGFLRQLGVERTFGSGTQDCANKFAASTAVFGSHTIHPIPDLEHCDFLLILGENPAISHMSFLSIPDPMKELYAARDRGARIVFVDPRRHESASAGEVLQILPDSDVYLLAAMIHVIDEERGFHPLATERGEHLDELRSFVARFPTSRAAQLTGLEEEQIREIALAFADAPRAGVHMSTGVNMGRQGTLGYWLVHVLSLVTGNLDQPGGNVLSEGFYKNAKAGRAQFEETFHETPYGRLRRGDLPGTLMAQAICDEERPIRAMFMMSGNPLLSIAGEEPLREALEGLDLLVVVDLYRNATAELADFVLPATDLFERSDITFNGIGLQHRPYVQWTPALVEPHEERREEWWIFERLAQQMGLTSLLDGPEPEQAVWGRIDHMLRTRGNSLEKLRESPHGIDFGPHQPGRFFEEHVQRDGGLVDCCPPAFEEALSRCLQIAEEMGEREGLLLITRRDRYGHNSWYANVERLRPKHHDRTFLYVHPADAEELGLAEGGEGRLSNEFGSLEAEIRFDESLRPGVVAVPHGWGNARTPGMRVAQKYAGANVNRLLPSGPGSFEPLSSQAHMTGIPVDLQPVSSQGR
ncbi:MAG: molybdopterin-dependent oxidoreductase [Acidobacteriota bacterium]